MRFEQNVLLLTLIFLDNVIPPKRFSFFVRYFGSKNLLRSIATALFFFRSLLVQIKLFLCAKSIAEKINQEPML